MLKKPGRQTQSRVQQSAAGPGTEKGEWDGGGEEDEGKEGGPEEDGAWPGAYAICL